MSIIIKDMEMPKNCDSCEFHWEEDISFEICHRCQITGSYIDKMDIYSFPYDCPLSGKTEKQEPCELCSNLEKGDTLYQYSDWDGGIGFDYIWDIQYCPKCGRELTCG